MSFDKNLQPSHLKILEFKILQSLFRYKNCCKTETRKKYFKIFFLHNISFICCKTGMLHDLFNSSQIVARQQIVKCNKCQSQSTGLLRAIYRLIGHVTLGCVMTPVRWRCENCSSPRWVTRYPLLQWSNSVWTITILAVNSKCLRNFLMWIVLMRHIEY